MNPTLKLLMEKLLKSKSDKSSSYQSKNFSLSPSVLGDECLRKKYYSYFKIPRAPNDISGILIMESGNNIHQMIQTWLADINVAIDYLDPKTGKVPINWGKPDIEFPISIPELLIQKGKIDRVVMIEGELWIVEIKSIGDRKFKELSQPAFDHMIQGMVYVFGFEKCLREGQYSHIASLHPELPVKGVRFIYANRDNGQMKEFPVERDENLFIQICQDINELAKYILSKELPPPPPGGMCKYCPYPDFCKNNRNVD